MADVYSILGDLYLAPTTATVGGTKLPGLDPQRPIRLITPHGIRTERHGYERDAVQSYVEPADEPNQLVLPAAGHDANTLKLLFATITADGATIQSAGGNALKAARLARETAAVVRPRDTSEMYWYMPRLQLFEDALPLMNRGYPDFAGIDDSLLVMLCARPLSSLQDAVFIGAPSDINSHYNLGSGTPLIQLVPGYADLGTVTEGEVGTPTSYRIEAWNLTGNLAVAAEAGVEYSVTGANGTYAASLSLAPTSGRVSQLVWVRFSTTAAEATFLETIAHTAAGATTRNLIAYGIVEGAGE